MAIKTLFITRITPMTIVYSIVEVGIPTNN